MDEAFYREGLLVLPRVFTGTQLDSLRRRALRVQALAQRRDWATRHCFRGVDAAVKTDPVQRARASWGIDCLERREVLDPHLLGVFGEPRIDETLRGLFGHQPLVRMTTLFWAARLVPYDLHWHRDLLPLDLYDSVASKPREQDHIRFYVALQQDRALRFVPGSHRRALIGDEREVAAARSRGSFPGEERLELEPGDVALFDPHLFHRAHTEVDDERLTLLYSVQAAWIPFPLGPFAAHRAWLTSDEFLARLDPATRPYYASLREAMIEGDPFAYLKAVLA